MAFENERQLDLERYLDSFMQNETVYPRKKCCGSSRSLYCTECYRLLIPKSEWPTSLRNGNLQLPFDLDILLCDRRKSATGLHALVLLQTSNLQSEPDGGFNENDGCIYLAQHEHPHVENDKKTSKNNLQFEDFEKSLLNSYFTLSDDNFRLRTKVRLFDMDDNNHKNSQSFASFSEPEESAEYRCDGQGTFVLFPSEDSVPLSEVASEINRLIVLDCKWTQSFSKQRLPEIADIRKVHLDSPPTESFFWRWHNAGKGMVSTLEAIYYASLEVAHHKEPHDSIFTNDNRRALIDLMWLFGLQRAATSDTVERHGRPLPFSVAGKQLQRDLRKKGLRKHKRNKKRENQLKEEKL